MAAELTLPRYYGPYGRNAIDFIDQFAHYGVNACWFHMFDESAFTLCAQYGVAPCVEFKTFRADFAQHPELVPIGVDGRPIRYGKSVQGICLSQTDYLAEIDAQLTEGLRTYHPSGVWLDYLTYAGWFETPTPDLQESCFCRACIADFCAACGVDATTPSEILARHGAQWTRHKCARIARFAADYASLIRAQQPDCLIGVYLCPWTPDEFDGALTRIFAQDYDLLAPAIDIFTPLIYAKKSGRPAHWGRQFLAASPVFVPADRPVQLILDALDFPESLQAIGDAQPASWGVQVFGGAAIFQNPEWAALFRDAVYAIERGFGSAARNPSH
jgi:hypothetical protein